MSTCSAPHRGCPTVLSNLGRALVLGLPLLFSLSCGDKSVDEPPEGPSPAQVDESGDPPIDEMFDELAAIGYADFSSSGSASELGTGVVHHEPERSVPGYTLYTSIPFSAAVLIDAAGNEVNRWHDECDRWTRTHLLPDGDLLVIGVCETEGKVAPFLARKRWNGTEAWRAQVHAHHDLDVLPDGRILVLTKSRRERPGYSESGMVRDNELTMLSADGEILQVLSITDMIDAGPWPFSWRPASDIPGYEASASAADYLHCNSVFWLSNSQLADRDPLYEVGNVLLSSRHQNCLLMVNWERRELLWSWGQGELQRQHEASVLPDGRILLFDNGSEERGWSRLVELDPQDGRIVWEYKADPPEALFSAGRGTVQSLRGGNLLVGNSGSGEAFEITRDGEIVWRFFNPDLGGQGAHGALRVQRYPTGMIDTILRTQDRPAGH